jgi:hypothetical protein
MGEHTTLTPKPTRKAGVIFYFTCHFNIQGEIIKKKRMFVQKGRMLRKLWMKKTQAEYRK